MYVIIGSVQANSWIDLTKTSQYLGIHSITWRQQLQIGYRSGEDDDALSAIHESRLGPTVTNSI
jgi:hypothetical protein